MSYDWMTAHRARYENTAPVDDDGEGDEEAEPVSVLVSVTSDVDLTPEKLPPSPKKLMLTINALGWEILGAREAVVHYAAALMMNDGTVRKDGTKALKGEVKSPECDEKILHVSVVDPTHQIGFTVTWVNGRFDHAIGYDPVGFLRECYFNYKPKNYVIKALGKTRALESAERYDADYNDATSYLSKTHKMKATEFSTWLNDWLAVKERKLNEPR